MLCVAFCQNLSILERCPWEIGFRPVIPASPGKTTIQYVAAQADKVTGLLSDPEPAAKIRQNPKLFVRMLQY